MLLVLLVFVSCSTTVTGPGGGRLGATLCYRARHAECPEQEGLSRAYFRLRSQSRDILDLSQQKMRFNCHPTSQRRPGDAVLLGVAIAICCWPGAQTFAADPPQNYPASASSIATSNGPIGVPLASSSNRSTQSSTSTGPSDGRCSMLRKKYAESEACFARYRMNNRGLRTGAFKRCKQLNDPSTECGSVGAD
jgi:hypothetical protein